MFIVVNIASACVAVIFGHSQVNKKIKKILCCGFFQKDNMISSLLLAIIVALSTNLAIVYLIKYTPGYESGFNVWELFLFFATRPRLAWVVSVSLSGFHGKRRSETVNTETQSTGVYPQMDQNFHVEDYESKEEYYWRTSANVSLLAECFLQFVALYYMIKTVMWGFSQGFYSPSFGDLQVSSSTENTARVMYIGAFVWCLFRIPFNCLVLLMTNPRIFSSFGPKKVLLWFVPMIWLPAWLFFGGFIALAGDM
jgi:hypothetical protein